MIYLAAPYSHKKATVRASRVAACSAIVAHMLQRGRYYYSPITHGHHIEQDIDKELQWQHWLEHSFQMINTLRRVALVELPGWAESKGVAKELEFCKMQKIPVSRISEYDAIHIIGPHMWRRLHA